MSAGHYTAYINSKGKWFCYDDARPYEIEIKDVTKNLENSYILLYIRKYVYTINIGT